MQLEERLQAVKAKDIMTKTVSTTKPTVALGDLAEEMIRARISGMPVMGKDNHVIGVVTTTDLLIVMGMIIEGKVEEQGDTQVNPSVDFAMSSDTVVTIDPDTTLADIVRLMRTKSIHTIPVMQNGELAGVIGKHDVLRCFYAIVNDLSK